ncbi:uncharacterized protein LOC134177995 [Corticium candelabrum]|uniref:uncharacterized protein LOC134177995 n=1 Tax=Corticium candelabrum TaxID=121492 RepID=UPI002E26FFCD|nr:uncharacterized protein LOC134177995 [Corticium candelabrum]
MIARKDRGVAGENPAWVLDTRTDKVQWTYAASAHGRFGPSALFHARHLHFQVFALETADGKFLGYDDNTGRITVDQEVSSVNDASRFLILTVDSTRYARFPNQLTIPLVKTSIICAITNNASFLVASHQEARSRRLGDARICSSSKESKKLRKIISELNTADYHFELLEAQLYVRWLSSDATRKCSRKLNCNSGNKRHLRHIWGQSYVCCPSTATPSEIYCNGGKA